MDQYARRPTSLHSTPSLPHNVPPPSQFAPPPPPPPPHSHSPPPLYRQKKISPRAPKHCHPGRVGTQRDQPSPPPPISPGHPSPFRSLDAASGPAVQKPFPACALPPSLLGSRPPRQNLENLPA